MRDWSGTAAGALNWVIPTPTTNTRRRDILLPSLLEGSLTVRAAAVTNQPGVNTLDMERMLTCQLPYAPVLRYILKANRSHEFRLLSTVQIPVLELLYRVR
jgi:hypothetical protein